MELHLSFPFHVASPLSKSKTTCMVSIEIPSPSISRISISSSCKKMALEQLGGNMVVELVGAFNEVTERMRVSSHSSSQLLFKALKLSIPALHSLPTLPDGRSPLSKALSLAFILADLQVNNPFTFPFSILNCV